VIGIRGIIVTCVAFWLELKKESKLAREQKGEYLLR
jgi:hypothetical protein